MKIYGAEICRGCREIKAVLDEKNIAYEFVNITENIPNLRMFLKMRDTMPMFDPIREEGRVGLPVIELDDGTLTLDVESVMANLDSLPVKEQAAEETEQTFCCGEKGC